MDEVKDKHMQNKIKGIVAQWLQKIQSLNRKQVVKSGIVLVIILFVIFIGIRLMRQMRVSIRQSQINEVATDAFQTTKKLTLIPYGELDEMVSKKAALSVLFVSPQAKNYQKIFQLINEKESELNRIIYVYPLVYDVQTTEMQYKLASSEATFVFFQKGVQKKQFTYASLKKPTSELIPEMNRLPMWNITDNETN